MFLTLNFPLSNIMERLDRLSTPCTSSNREVKMPQPDGWSWTGHFNLARLDRFRHRSSHSVWKTAEVTRISSGQTPNSGNAPQVPIGENAKTDRRTLADFRGVICGGGGISALSGLKIETYGTRFSVGFAA
jgi:hypothetical protein